MLGSLPTTLNINGTDYAIETDFRNILEIFLAYADPELTDKEKVYVCLRRIYKELGKIPAKDYEEAYKAASSFMSCGMDGDKKGPQIVDWEKDEMLIFPAINKVAGTEVRALPYLHWWTFMGYYQSVDGDGLWGFVLTIRQKKAKGKKLEKYEKEFYNSNRELFNHKSSSGKIPSAEDDLLAMFENLLKDGEENGGS